MIKSRDCIKRFGRPTVRFEYAHMENFHTPHWARKAFPFLPEKIYMNRQMIVPFRVALYNIIDRGLEKEFKSFNGCFNIRKMRGKPNVWSLHSWGIAIDINADENPLHGPVRMSEAFAQCFIDAGFDWGGHWTDPIDGMHFQLSYLT